MSKKMNFKNYICVVFCLPIFVIVPGITVDIPGSILATPLVGSKLLDIPPPPLILKLEQYWQLHLLDLNYLTSHIHIKYWN